jgi:hypothetical protein
MRGALLQAGAEAGADPRVGALFAFLISLLVGTFAINLGARLVVDSDTGYRRAAVTALIGALVWGLIAFFLGWIPLLGPLLALVAWIGIINWRYEGGWGTAVAIGLVAWLVAVGVLYLLSVVGIVGLDALGIPGA